MEDLPALFDEADEGDRRLADSRRQIGETVELFRDLRRFEGIACKYPLPRRFVRGIGRDSKRAQLSR